MAKKAAPKAAESKPEPKAETKPEPKVEAKPEPKGETSATIAAKKAESAAGKKEKPAAKAEPKPATRPKAQTKAEIVAALADKTGVERKSIGLIFDALQEMIASDLDKKGPGVFIIPGMVKFKIVNKPASPERERRNPQTGAPMMTKAKPAHNIVKAVLLKSLKDLPV